MLGAQNHDLHHEHFNYNYGTALFMDKIFDTNYIGSDFQKRVEARKRKENQKMAEKEESDEKSTEGTRSSKED